MRNGTKILIYFTLLFLTISFREEISTYLLKTFVFKSNVVLQNINEYRLTEEFEFLSSKQDFYAKSKQDIYNIIYTVVNNGWNDFNFYCDNSYKKCISDVEDIIENPYYLSYINNYVHPYNSYDRIHLNYTSLGRVEVVVEKLYTDEEIVILNKKIDEISKTLYRENMTMYDKIRAVHNYIIDNTKYDNVRATAIINNQEFKSEFDSHKATGPLVQGMGICGGYSDAMSLFLINLGVKNYRVSNDSHIWNYAFVEDKWYHLDLTWDDPVVNTGENILLTTYFLINTNQLKKIDDGKHYYDGTVFIEAQ